MNHLVSLRSSFSLSVKSHNQLFCQSLLLSWENQCKSVLEIGPVFSSLLWQICKFKTWLNTYLVPCLKKGLCLLRWVGGKESRHFNLKKKKLASIPHKEVQSNKFSHSLYDLLCCPSWLWRTVIILPETCFFSPHYLTGIMMRMLQGAVVYSVLARVNCVFCIS